MEFLKEADVIVTNPPFSLFRQYVAQLVEYEKRFLILGNNNAITYKEIFPLIMENKLWLGYSANKTMEFVLPDSYEKWDRIENGVKIGKVPAISWFTNLTHSKRNRPLDLVQRFDERYYNVYDDYPAVNIDKVMDIPCDENIMLTLSKEVYPKWQNAYGEDCLIIEDNGDSVKVKIHNPIYGVPITFLDKYCPTQFRIVGLDSYVEDNPHYGYRFRINNKVMYARIVIRKLSD